MPNKRVGLKTILIAGLIAGTLDLFLAIIFFAVQQGASVSTVPHAVASGLLGVRAFRGGMLTAVLGVVLQYFIALSVAGFYYAASLRIRFLNSHALFSGAVYGIGVFLFMQYIVLPLSAVRRSHSHGNSWFIADISSHVVFIGITIALITRHYAKRSP